MSEYSTVEITLNLFLLNVVNVNMTNKALGLVLLFISPRFPKGRSIPDVKRSIDWRGLH